ncbi:MAG TPA: hypothetical protein VH352_23140 [Pseudonocardiaceae bacterium]|nr:hypothetical protein [Pseudonocardiaceae bacterium]
MTDSYNAHPGRTPADRRLTGVIIVDGLPPTPGEAPADHKGKWVGRKELPITVDRAQPTVFRIEWDQVIAQDPRAMAQQRALDEATKLSGGQAAMGTPIQSGAPVTVEGDFSSVQDALRSVGLDPGLLNSPGTTVHVSMGTDADGASPDAMRAMLANMAGNRAGATVPATGVVRGVHDVVAASPMPAGMSQADITLDVLRPDGSTYPATTRIGFSTTARRAAIATLGTTLPLLVSKNDPGRLVIDVGRLHLP